MCGRAAAARPAAAVAHVVAAARMIGPDAYRPRYNAGPGAYLPVVRADVPEDEEAADEADEKMEAAAEERMAESNAPTFDEPETETPQPTQAPTAPPAVFDEEPLLPHDPPRVVHVMKWGLVPSFMPKDKVGKHGLNGFSTFNARSESVKSSNFYRRLLKRRRCIVPIDGFFEWKKEMKLGKQRTTPFFVKSALKGPLFIAGLWDKWNDSEGKPLYTFTLLTTDSSKALGWLHDRMPVILDAEGAQKWLDVDNFSFDDCRPIHKPFAGELKWYAVSDKVNKIGNEGPDVLEPLEAAKEKQFAAGLGRFFTKTAATKRKEDGVTSPDKKAKKEEP